MSIKDFRQRFRDAPSNLSAGNYLNEAVDGISEKDTIGDDEFLDIVAEVAYWLTSGALLMLPDKPR